MPRVKAVSKTEKDKTEEIVKAAGAEPRTKGMSFVPGEFRTYHWMTQTTKEANDLKERLKVIEDLEVVS